jgi:hypothetical protein
VFADLRIENGSYLIDDQPLTLTKVQIVKLSDDFAGHESFTQTSLNCNQSPLSRNYAIGIKRKGAEPQRRKGRRRKRLRGQRSPFGDPDWQGQFFLCALASLRLGVEIFHSNCIETA